MKLINIITHPVLVIISFCTILVSGESFGGFYLMYLLMALPHGGLHSLLALLGTGLVLLSYGKYKRESKFFIELLLNILGIFSLYASLWLFFYKSWDYNDGTFEQSVPIISLILFGLVSLGFLIRGITGFTKNKPHTKGLLT